MVSDVYGFNMPDIADNCKVSIKVMSCGWADIHEEKLEANITDLNIILINKNMFFPLYKRGY